MAALAPDDVCEEIEALEAIYFDECRVVKTWAPLHLEIAMKPRTAEDQSLQFVQTTLAFKASTNYPEQLPELTLENSKGLGDFRQAHLLQELQKLMEETPQGGLLVATAEAAFDLLTSMNLPEGDCCFCMTPFADSGADRQEDVRQLIKFTNCFHCFHRHCCLDWFRWQLRQHEAFLSDVRRPKPVEGDPSSASDEFALHCPVCRASVNAEDIGRLRTLASDAEEQETREAEPVETAFVPTPEDQARQGAFAKLLETQRGRGGLIEERAATPGTSGGVALVHSSALWKAEDEAPVTSGRDEELSERPNSGARRDSGSNTASEVGGASTQDDGRGPSSRRGALGAGEGFRGEEERPTSSGRGGRGNEPGRGQGRRSPCGRGSQPGRDERGEGWDAGSSRGGAARSNRGAGRQSGNGINGRGGQPGSRGRGRGFTRDRRMSGEGGALNEGVSELSDRLRDVGSSGASILGSPPVLRGDRKGQDLNHRLEDRRSNERSEAAVNGLLGAAPTPQASRGNVDAQGAGLRNAETRQSDRGKVDRTTQQRQRNQGRPSGRGRGSTVSAANGQPPNPRV
ncbi:putative RWD domain-containing protein [Klebsormidium nitens]|uniref:Putative RWD domain-containing protein n=1 Tax=Klebsormidium nitens TaxID=105231 RepID=A0A1Y1IBS6_KLENI|nr:putative RWD domain-containing protein [Klebsormidium nitens]|eukprot:GAQ87422.1 putative RWD domain-containing protein [Klebsormidium nitens]